MNLLAYLKETECICKTCEIAISGSRSSNCTHKKQCAKFVENKNKKV